MAKLAIKKGSTSVSLYLFIHDSSSLVGAGLTGLVFNTASLVAYYVRPLGSATAITLATQTVTGAWSSGGFVEVSATNMPGVYRFDVPDAVLATGVNSVVVMLKGAANMAPVLLEIELDAYDPQDTVRLGLTALPNVAAGGNGGLPLGDADGLVGVQGLIMQRTTIATLASQTSFTLTAGSADNNAYKDSVILIEDAATAAQKAVGIVSAYTGASKTITLVTDPGIFTMAVGDIVTILSFSATAYSDLKSRTDYIALIAPGTMWDAVGTSHQTAGTFGQLLQIVESGTLQAADATHATLRSGASATNDDPSLVGRILYIESGTGAGQGTRIVSYVGSTKVATVDGWRTTTPDSTSKYIVI